MGRWSDDRREATARRVEEPVLELRWGVLIRTEGENGWCGERVEGGGVRMVRV